MIGRLLPEPQYGDDGKPDCCCYHVHVDECRRKQQQRQVRRMLMGLQEPVPNPGAGLWGGVLPNEVIEIILRYYAQLPPPAGGQFRLLVT